MSTYYNLPYQTSVATDFKVADSRNFDPVQLEYISCPKRATSSDQGNGQRLYNVPRQNAATILDGPIIQEIPGGLIVGDYIEIHGVCRGPEVIVELLSREGHDSVPLRMRMSSGGPISIRSQSSEKVEVQERNVRMGLQPNLGFELIIYAMKNEYEIKLNKHTVCTQKHLVDLEEISAIAMDGDADFTSIEFKDIYGDEEDKNMLVEQADQGMMRVQELRDSFSRRKGSPVFVRSSIRRSNRSDRIDEPKVAGATTWATSNDLSRPDYDVDPIRSSNNAILTQPVVGTHAYTAAAPDAYPSRESYSPKSKNRFSWKPGPRGSLSFENKDTDVYTPVGSRGSGIIAGEHHQGTYRTVEENQKMAYRPGAQTLYTGSLGTLNDSQASLHDKQKKKRSSLFGKLRKSKGSESDISIGGTDKTHKRKGIKNLFKSRKSVTLSHTGEIDHTSSLPDITTPPSGFNRLSGDFNTTQPLYLSMAADRTPIRGPVPKSICKGPAPEIAAYMASQKAVPEFENFTLANPQAYTTSTLPSATESRQSIYSTGGDNRKLKGTAPQVADILLSSERAGYDDNTTLTNELYPEPVRSQIIEPAYGRPVSQVVDDKKKTKGPAPEIAATLNDERYDYRYDQDTTLVDDRMVSNEVVPSTRTSVARLPGEHVKSGKLKGTAPEVAADLYEGDKNTLQMIPETTLTGPVVTQKQPYQPIERPVFDRDPVYNKPQYVERAEAPKVVHGSRSKSLDRYDQMHNGGDDSSVQSDGEYYLEVGRSDYYNERRRSLKLRRSRRSRNALRASGASYGSLNDSTRSSVSSLRSNERILLTPQNRWDDRRQINSWMDRQADPYRDEPTVYYERASRPIVYAAAPVVKQRDTEQFVLTEKELRRGNYSAKFPLALTPGRNARLTGHFEPGTPEDKSCSITLSTGTPKDISGLTGLLLQLWPNGRLVVDGIKHNNKNCILKRDANHNKDETMNFALEFHARGLYFAITLNDTVSLKIVDDFDPSRFELIQMQPCTHAKLDQFSVSNTLVTPVDMFYPGQSHRRDTQSLTLSTRMTADTKSVLLEFITQTGKTFGVKLDFVQDCVYAYSADAGTNVVVEAARQTLPMVPEQIRQLTVTKQNNENTLLIFVNQMEIYNHLLPVSKPSGKLSRVRISGDLLVFSTKFN